MGAGNIVIGGSSCNSNSKIALAGCHDYEFDCSFGDELTGTQEEDHPGETELLNQCKCID